MKVSLVLATITLIGLVACATAPELRVAVDTRELPYLKYERDHAECLEKARAVYPVTQTQLRRQPAVYYYRLKAQETIVKNCLTKKGYRVLEPEEWEPW